MQSPDTVSDHSDLPTEVGTLGNAEGAVSAAGARARGGDDADDAMNALMQRRLDKDEELGPDGDGEDAPTRGAPHHDNSSDRETPPLAKG
jgi:hypothetical protein